jgi:hypothetical protein
MAEPNRHRLKSVLEQVPPGFLVDSRWLAASDVARSSAHDYHREGWLERVERGVYRRPYPHADSNERRDWKMPVLSAQWIMGYDFHVGGMTALTLDGQNHYVAIGRSSKVYLYGNVPSWLPKLSLDAKFQLRRRQLFGADPLGIDNRNFDPGAANAPNPWNWPFLRSSPERAILEALNELPDEESFHVVDMVFQGLTALRPGRLDNLLAACRSVKVKRLFFLFADRHNHSWLRHIDRANVDLGKGPRSLVDGGSYVAAYQLVVPSEFAPARRDEPEQHA